MRLILIRTFAALMVMSAVPAVAQQKTSIRFILDWKYQSIHAFVFWARRRATSPPKISRSRSIKGKGPPRP